LAEEGIERFRLVDGNDFVRELPEQNSDCDGGEQFADRVINAQFPLLRETPREPSEVLTGKAEPLESRKPTTGFTPFLPSGVTPPRKFRH
jgi:hypothetical protein